MRQARQAFGDALPEDYLNDKEYKLYERLYGPPFKIGAGASPEYVDFEQAEVQGELQEQQTAGTGLLKENAHGELEEVDYLPEDSLEHDEELEMEDEEGAEEKVDLDPRELNRLEKSKKGRFFIKATKLELDRAILDPGLSKSDEASMTEIDKDWSMMDQAGRTMYLEDVRYMKLEKQFRDQNNHDGADELLQMLFIRYRSQKAAEMQALDTSAQKPATQAIATGSTEGVDERNPNEPEGFQRVHPLTSHNRFGSSPATLQLPKSTLVDPISVIISASAPKHLAEAAHKIFGGTGLPYSTSNPALAKVMQQKPIPLEASQTKMSEIEADAFFATLMPGMYASVTSVIIETRKRLGSSWLEGLLSKEGGPRILDAGGAGVGVLAVREALRAEWTRMHDNSDDPEAPVDLAMPGGQTGGAPIDTPVGKATVLTSSDTLRMRASALLDDTTFLPRLPDYVHASDEQAREKGKFDIIIAPHTLWGLKEDYIRKKHVSNLWSLLDSQGGILILLEKGVPRGFEIVAAAREFLLNKRIASPGEEEKRAELDDPELISIDGVIDKEKGMIVAPCTNHSSCPMYTKGGVSKGRKDYCHFEQRYIRPPFLQKLLGARDKNFEDVQFSYVSIMRGRDLRDRGEEAVVQGQRATDRAFIGYEHEVDLQDLPERNFDPTAPAVPEMDDFYDQGLSSTPNSLSLPRLVLPPLKRTGHVILDMCTPSGTVERWTVPRSFSKQAFRDARKSSWGDLWALGAKTRVQRNVRLGMGKEELGGVDNPLLTSAKKKVRNEQAAEKKRKAAKSKKNIEDGYDSERIPKEDIKVKNGGRMRHGKVAGIRDKRDKKATGHGRRKASMDV